MDSYNTEFVKGLLQKYNNPPSPINELEREESNFEEEVGNQFNQFINPHQEEDNQVEDDSIFGTSNHGELFPKNISEHNNEKDLQENEKNMHDKLQKQLSEQFRLTIEDVESIVQDSLGEEKHTDVDIPNEKFNLSIEKLTNVNTKEVEEYVVEQILSKRVQNRQVQYFVKWFGKITSSLILSFTKDQLGYPSSQNTWEPIQNLLNIKRMIYQFEFNMKQTGEGPHISSKNLKKEYSELLRVISKQNTSLLIRVVYYIVIHIFNNCISYEDIKKTLWVSHQDMPTQFLEQYAECIQKGNPYCILNPFIQSDDEAEEFLPKGGINTQKPKENEQMKIMRKDTLENEKQNVQLRIQPGDKINEKRLFFDNKKRNLLFSQHQQMNHKQIDSHDEQTRNGDLIQKKIKNNFEDDVVEISPPNMNYKQWIQNQSKPQKNPSLQTTPKQLKNQNQSNDFQVDQFSDNKRDRLKESLRDIYDKEDNSRGVQKDDSDKKYSHQIKQHPKEYIREYAKENIRQYSRENHNQQRELAKYNQINQSKEHLRDQFKDKQRELIRENLIDNNVEQIRNQNIDKIQENHGKFLQPNSNIKEQRGDPTKIDHSKSSTELGNRKTMVAILEGSFEANDKVSKVIIRSSEKELKDIIFEVFWKDRIDGTPLKSKLVRYEDLKQCSPSSLIYWLEIIVQNSVNEIESEQIIIKQLKEENVSLKINPPINGPKIHLSNQISSEKDSYPHQPSNFEDQSQKMYSSISNQMPNIGLNQMQQAQSKINGNQVQLQPHNIQSQGCIAVTPQTYLPHNHKSGNQPISRNQQAQGNQQIQENQQIPGNSSMQGNQQIQGNSSIPDNLQMFQNNNLLNLLNNLGQLVGAIGGNQIANTHPFFSLLNQNLMNPQNNQIIQNNMNKNSSLLSQTSSNQNVNSQNLNNSYVSNSGSCSSNNEENNSRSSRNNFQLCGNPIQIALSPVLKPNQINENQTRYENDNSIIKVQIDDQFME